MSTQTPFHQEGKANKVGLAYYYQVSIRTLDYWIAWQIIRGQMVSGEHIFDIRDCDERLADFTRKKSERG